MDAHAPVGGQAVFPALTDNGADAAGEICACKGDMGDGKHDGACLRQVCALKPEIGPWKGGTPVGFDVAHAAVKAAGLPVHREGAGQGMGHADDPVDALHGQKAEGPHNIRGQRRQRAVPQGALHPRQRNFCALLRKNAGSGPDDTPLHTKRLHVKLAGAAVVNHLHKRAPSGPAGNKGDGLSVLLMLEIPALKASHAYGRPLSFRR
ncbi:hypothetical protein SDC9_175210 [bioreactor metagenome]|uniref:Uncharacterized protein n=1 Tax=bioreactor metagenome TaxID=1076179 RepID=A0A645GNM6_9ZZZZ